MTAMKERDIGFEMSGRLVNEHGFEQDHTWRGRFRKIVDAEHAAVVTFSSWREPGGGAGRGVPIFGVARSDINLLEDQLLDRKVKGQWRATIEERGKAFFVAHGRPLGGFTDIASDRTHAYSEQEIVDWVDTWVPRLVEDATSLPWLRGKLAEYHEAFQRLPGDQTKNPRMMNKLLDGRWTQADDEELFGPLRAVIEKFPDDEKRVSWLAQIQRVHDWVDEHPNGVKRELAD